MIYDLLDWFLPKIGLVRRVHFDRRTREVYKAYDEKYAALRELYKVTGQEYCD